MSLIGSLEEVKIGDVLRLLASGRKSGALTVERTAGPPAVLHFQKGAVVNAACGSLAGEHVVLQLFGWREGQMSFVPDDRPVPTSINRAVEALIADGLELGDTLHKVFALIPSDKAVFQWGGGPADDAVTLPVGRSEWRVLRLVDGQRDVREVAAQAGLPREQALRVLADFLEAGFLEKVELVRALRVQAQGLFGKDAAELDERLEAEWRRIQRFAHGVGRIEVRSLKGRAHTFAVSFRTGLYKDVALPRQALAELGLSEREEVFVRPMA
jgi:hypothetical protein